jgi:hypothetical protein
MRDRTGLLIIRAWLEDGSERPLRASVRLTTDVATGIEREFTVTDADTVCAEVRAWLRELGSDGV